MSKLNPALQTLAKKRSDSSTKPSPTPLNTAQNPKPPTYHPLPALPKYSYKSKSNGPPVPEPPSSRHTESQQWSQSLKTLLRQTFNHSSFYPLQEPIINSVLQGDDLFVILPTGSGKSLTYQLPSLLTTGLTIIVQPLLSLITDQISKLNELHLKASQYNSNLLPYELCEELKRIEADQEIKVLYTSPEMLSKSSAFLDFLDNLYRKKAISRLVIDEVHCMLQWGNDFRPDYKKLDKFRTRFPEVPIMALTASATAEMVLEISKSLKLRSPILFREKSNRENLFYQVKKKGDLINSEIGKFITERHENDSGIIYCNFIADCETLAKVLKYTFKLSVAIYHGQLTADKKNEVYLKWISQDINIIICTMAFGLGIDKKNVRFVIHYSIPESLELYYQETGRAGRDGLSSDCLLFYKYEDKLKIESAFGRKDNSCYNMIEFCENIFECRRRVLLEFFGEKYSPDLCNKMCDNCLNPKKGFELDLTEESKIIVADVFKNLNGFCTICQMIEVLKGSKSKNNQNLSDLGSFGLLKKWQKEDIERFIRKLVYSKVLNERNVKKKFGNFDKIVDGELAGQLLAGVIRVNLMSKINYLGISGENRKEYDKKNEEGVREDYKERIVEGKEGSCKISSFKEENASPDFTGNKVGDVSLNLEKPVKCFDYKFKLNLEELDEEIAEYRKRKMVDEAITMKMIKK